MIAALRPITRLWQQPSAEELAVRELESAKRNLLEAQRNAEYYALMVTFERQRISRLTTAALLNKEHKL